MWSVGDLIKEMYSLGDKFVDYKRGLVTIPSKTAKTNEANSKLMQQATFRPKINKLSERIEQRNWMLRLQSEQMLIEQMDREFQEKNKNDVSQMSYASSASEVRKGLAGRIVKRTEVTASAI